MKDTINPALLNTADDLKDITVKWGQPSYEYPQLKVFSPEMVGVRGGEKWAVTTRSTPNSQFTVVDTNIVKALPNTEGGNRKRIELPEREVVGSSPMGLLAMQVRLESGELQIAKGLDIPTIRRNVKAVDQAAAKKGLLVEGMRRPRINSGLWVEKKYDPEKIIGNGIFRVEGINPKELKRIFKNNQDLVEWHDPLTGESLGLIQKKTLKVLQIHQKAAEKVLKKYNLTQDQVARMTHDDPSLMGGMLSILRKEMEAKVRELSK